MWLIIVLYALCASSFTISKAVLAYSAPLFFVGVRMTIAGLLLLSAMRILGQSMRIARADWHLFGGIVMFHIYGAYVLDLISLQYISSSLSSFFFNMSPFITALFAFFALGETLTWKKWIGLMIGFFGIIITMQSEAGCIFGSGMYWPELLLLAGVASSCIGWVIVKELVLRSYSPLFINGFGMLIGGALALITSCFFESWWQQSPVNGWGNFIWLTFLIIVVCNILFYNLYGYLLKVYSATFLSFAGFTCPIFAALFGFLALGEVPPLVFWYASCVVAIGLYIFYQDELHAVLP